ncbi:MAG: TraU family protein [Methylococcales bacterium]
MTTLMTITSNGLNSPQPRKKMYPHWPKVLLLLLSLHTPVKAEPVSCLNLMVVGVCLWLVCTAYECHTEETVKIGHFNPEVQVLVSEPVGVERTEDAYRTDTHNRNHQNLIFEDARAVGNPLAGMFYCPSQAKPLMPYFISEIDTPEWRWGAFEAFLPFSWIPGLREIGHWPFNTWQNLYPRTGWTTQSSPPKSAASVAQRVGDIITRVAQLHLYIPLFGEADSAEKLVWEPMGLLENTNFQGYWQLLSPVFEPGCMVFGENDTLNLTDWGGGRAARDGDYSYTLWRPYTCCEIKGSFIGAIDFILYPLPL